MKIIIDNYDPNWPIIYEAERKLILKACRDKIQSIEHIGSTSVPGLGAKPIIDILLGVSSFADADAIVPAMISLGYIYINKYENVMPYRRYFSKDRKYHVHCVEVGSSFWKRHLAFRDYLRINDNVRDDYDILKRKLAEKDWNDSNDYAYAKTDFVRGIEKEALKYFSEIDSQ